MRRNDFARSQEISAAAHFLDFEGLIVPSLRWPCSNLVVFMDRLEDLESLTVLDSRDINWPAWIAATDKLSPGPDFKP